MTNSMLGQIVALPNMAMWELKALWRELYATDPPPYKKSFLVRRLAYRIQEMALSGLDQETEVQLEAVALDKTKLPPRPPKDGIPVPGTRLVREWKGVEHSVTVLENGFEYQGRRFRTLSAVANHITGSRWNGHIFWGLKKAGRRK